jgi:uncharacterized protein (TIGR02271 family)
MDDTDLRAERDLDHDPAVTVHEERLDVATRQVAVERVRVRKVIVEEQVMVPVTVRREELRVERVPVAPGDEAAQAPVADADAGPLELVLSREEPVVGTRVVPVERVRVFRAPVVDERTIHETLRREEVEVDLPPEQRR